ncbi:MAG: lycopene cyclase domain-containing protein, partial [Gemmatimonadota bacterium]
VAVLGLPIEEMLFFASAGVMTVNGLVLFEWVLDWNDRRGRPTEAATGAFEPEPEPESPEPFDD